MSGIVDLMNSAPNWRDYTMKDDKTRAIAQQWNTANNGGGSLLQKYINVDQSVYGFKFDIHLDRQLHMMREQALFVNFEGISIAN